MYLPTALFFPIMPSDGTGQEVCWGCRTDPCVVLGPKPQAELRRGWGTIGPRTICEVQWVHGKPAGNVLPDTLPHREKVLVLQGLGKGTEVCQLCGPWPTCHRSRPGLPPRRTCGGLCLQMEFML